MEPLGDRWRAITARDKARGLDVFFVDTLSGAFVLGYLGAPAFVSVVGV